MTLVMRRATVWTAMAAVVLCGFNPRPAHATAEGSKAPEDQRVERILSAPAFKAAVASFDRTHDRFVREIVALTEIPSPPFGEKARGDAYLKLLKEHGLADAHMDAEGNVLGVRKGTGKGPLLAVAAHLDTVFPAGTDVRVRRDGTILRAPGVGDDTRALALVLAMLRAMDEAKLQTASDILFIGDVGEEGPGDLRGMRYLFTKGPYQGRIARFLSIDGGDNSRLTNGALGSKRYRVTFKGPGGHSWAAFGLVSPSFALGNAMTKFSRIQVPRDPKVSYNIGVIGGGVSVNSIPFEAWMDTDMRSASPADLAKGDTEFKRLMAEAAAEENAARSTEKGGITVDIKLIGDRPSGTTPPDSPLARQVAAVVRAYGRTPHFETSSTDSNIPISLGIPALTISAFSKGHGERAHAPDEWTDIEPSASVKDFAQALATVLAVADLP